MCACISGQTGAGKSFSMTGCQSDPGILPRACEVLFHFIATNPGEGVQWRVCSSYYEIFNEKIRDLLTTDEATLKVREDKKRGVFVDKLSYVSVENYEDIALLMDEGLSNRTVQATKVCPFTP